MRALFVHLLQASLVASAAIFTLLLLRRLLKNRVRMRVFTFLWMLVLLRLIFISPIPSPFPSSRGLPALEVIAEQAAEEADTADTTIELPSEPVPMAPSPADSPAAGRHARPLGMFRLLFLLWASGAVMLGLALLIAYLCLLTRMQRASFPLCSEGYTDEMKGQRVYLCERITTPVTTGVLRPRIYLPLSFDFSEEETVRHIILHEKNHIKWKDNLLKLVSLLALCLHWFNPMVWLLVKVLGEDIELSCDESVIADLGTECRITYAQSLVSIAEQNHKPSLTGAIFASFGYRHIKERVFNAMKKKFSARLSLCLALLLASSVLTGFAAASPARASLEEKSTHIGHEDEDQDHDEDDDKKTTLKPDVLKLITEAKAKEIALAKAGSGSVTKCELEKDDGVYRYKVKVVTSDAKYDITLDATTGAVLKQTKNPIEAPKPEAPKLITEAKAKEIALAKAGSGSVTKCELEKDDGVYRYKVKIVTSDAKYDITLDAATGTVLKQTKTPIETPKPETPKLITEAKAKEIALTKAGSGSVTKCELEKGDGVYQYKVKVLSGDTQYEYDIDAVTGTILKSKQKDVSKEKDKLPDGVMTADKVKAIALKHAGSGTVTKCKLESKSKKGVAAYKVVIRSDGTEYEYKINARTGEIIKYKAKSK